MTVEMHWPDHLLTLEDWIALPEDSSRSYELVEGVLVVSPRPVSQHQRAIWRLAAQLEPQLPSTHGVLTESEVLIDASPLPTIRVPDVLVVLEAGIDANQPRWDAADVLLAVEILSAGSRRTDRVTKFFEYADAGIEHYWLVDLDKPTSLAAYHLIDGDYELAAEQSGRMTVDLAGTGITIDIAALTSSRTDR
ncbi:Uma2 family endonuclease [Nocardia sp. NBC_00508]|uniref:Uma2 family endonuclease n=1 Tax=Nocardia sp. NBC_00508 TaxID=2975992 RepID=UPI002E81FE19|nr:Uma2 family endonuclease [Nocardia sp. NBC_00508]WUD69145.1 Uma2 family endonuclease [Nocardia sp. NBC_00508]